MPRPAVWPQANHYPLLGTRDIRTGAGPMVQCKSPFQAFHYLQLNYGPQTLSAPMFVPDAVFIINSYEAASAGLQIPIDGSTFELLAAVPEQETAFGTSTSGVQN